MIAVVHGERGRLTPSVETGEAWFEGLDAEAQRKHMPSEAAYQAYKYGEVTLRDFVGQRESARWGSMRYARSLTEMVGAERAKWWAGVARREKGFSQHPVDWAVRRAIFQGDVLSGEAWEATLEYLRGVPFNPRYVDVAPPMVGNEYLGHVLRRREPSLLAHLVKRVMYDGQWQEGTTAEEYLGDLRRVVDAWEGAALYKRRGNVVFLFGATENVVPEHRLGPNAGAYTAMVYSADRGRILSGYQFRSLDEVNIPETALWLWREMSG